MAFEEVSSVNSKQDTIGADLRYLDSREKFEISEKAFNILNANNNGMRMYVDPETDTILLSVQDREESMFYKGREDTETKSQLFTARKLWRALGNTYTDEEGFALTEFSLQPVDTPEGMEDGRLYLEVVPYEGGESPLNTLVEGDQDEDQTGLDFTREPNLPEEEEEEVSETVSSDENASEEETEEAVPAGEAEGAEDEDPFDL